MGKSLSWKKEVYTHRGARKEDKYFPNCRRGAGVLHKNRGGPFPWVFPQEGGVCKGGKKKKVFPN